MRKTLATVIITLSLLAGFAQTAQAQQQGVAPQLFFRETDQTLPLGLWRLVVSNDKFSLEKNTAANGAFGTVTSVFSATGSTVAFGTYGITANTFLGTSLTLSSTLTMGTSQAINGTTSVLHQIGGSTIMDLTANGLAINTTDTTLVQQGKLIIHAGTNANFAFNLSSTTARLSMLNDAANANVAVIWNALSHTFSISDTTVFKVIGGPGTAGGGLITGSYRAGLGALWSNAVTPSTVNYAFAAGSTATYLQSPLGGSVNIGANDTDYVQFTAEAGMLPISDNSISNGGASNRWSNIYAALGKFGTATGASTVDIVSGTLATTVSSLNITGTLAASNTVERGVYVTITSNNAAGIGAATNQQAMYVDLLAGYTGSRQTSGASFRNYTAGTGTTIASGYVNIGVYAQARGTTVGYNFGTWSDAYGGDLSIGGYNTATSDKAAATNVGAMGLALNTTGGSVSVGGFFGLLVTPPSLASSTAGLIVTNGTTTGNIVDFWDNTTSVFKIADGGAITGVGGKFTMDANGNITKINNVTTSFPASQGAANTILANDGSGNLSWVDNSGGLDSRVSTQFDKTSSTSPSAITGLSATVVAGRTYEFEAILYTTSNVAGGVKFTISDGSFVIASAIVYEAIVYSAAGTVAQTRATSINTEVGGITTVTAALVRITGTLTVTTGGPLKVGFAQNTSSVSASSVLVGSTFSVRDIT